MAGVAQMNRSTISRPVKHEHPWGWSGWMFIHLIASQVGPVVVVRVDVSFMTTAPHKAIICDTTVEFFYFFIQTTF